MEFVIKKRDLDFAIYSNIVHFAKSRGYEITDQSYPLTEDVFINKKSSEKHILVLNKDVNFLQITTDSDYNKKEKLTKIINKLNAGTKLFIIKPSGIKVGNIPHNNYEVISGNTYLIRNWIKDKDKKGRKIKATDKQWEVLQEDFIVEGKDLPGLSSDSHEAKWYGLNVGDVISMEMPSLSSNGIQSGYHIVTKDTN